MLRAIERFFVSWRFAVFAIALLALFAGLLGALLLVPPAPSGLGAFAEQFRVWCFGADATAREAGGFMRFAMFFELISLAALIGLVWYRPLRERLARGARPMLPYVGAAATVVALLSAAMWLLGGPGEDVARFPARELRTALGAPPVELTGQDGEPVSLAKLGGVAIVTGVYASCGMSCPRVLGQLKSVVGALTPEERARLSVLAITLDPEHDSVEVLAELAKAQGVRAPLYRLLTGDPGRVNATLDAYQIERRRDPQTGVIDHSNVFALIDREGRLAYRFTLGELQERWMLEALRLLLAERGALAAALAE